MCLPGWAGDVCDRCASELVDSTTVRLCVGLATGYAPGTIRQLFAESFTGNGGNVCLVQQSVRDVGAGVHSTFAEPSGKASMILRMGT